MLGLDLCMLRLMYAAYMYAAYLERRKSVATE